jgi:hypothetical protein
MQAATQECYSGPTGADRLLSWLGLILFSMFIAVAHYGALLIINNLAIPSLNSFIFINLNPLPPVINTVLLLTLSIGATLEANKNLSWPFSRINIFFISLISAAIAYFLINKAVFLANEAIGAQFWFFH